MRAVRSVLLGLLVAFAAMPAHAARPVRPLGQIKKAGAKVAVVQGSFDWVHAGHLELFRSAVEAKGADGRPKFDHVVVVPTRSYDKKPFLRGSWKRRVALLEAAVAEDPTLRGRVTISTMQAHLPSTPGAFVQALRLARPDLHFGYVLGADSFNDSKAWPGIGEPAVLGGVDLLVTPRPGYTIDDTSRAAAVLGAAKTKISSTQIRDALDAGDLSSVAHAVPHATQVALEAELARREAARKAGARLLPGPKQSYKSFATLGQERPRGAVDLLAGLDERDLPDEVREHLATVQAQVQSTHEGLGGEQLSVSKKGIDPKAGYTDKLVVLARRDGKLAGQYLFKKLSVVDAKKVESLTLLANLLGVPTPIAVPHTLTEPGARYTSAHGVLVPWIAGLETTMVHDFGKQSPKVHEALLVSRWFNEVVGNQDVWWGQFMRPKASAQKHEEILAIDFDGAFTRREAKAVQQVLKSHWGKDVPLEETAWTDKHFDFGDKVGWAPSHYDSRFTMYGPFLAAYVTGKIDIDLERVKAQVRAVKKIPAAAIRHAMAGYLDEAAAAHWGQVPLQAAGRFVPRDEFARRLERRIYKSVDEFCAFLDTLQAARNQPGHEIYEFYRGMKAGW